MGAFLVVLVGVGAGAGAEDGGAAAVADADARRRLQNTAEWDVEPGFNDHKHIEGTTDRNVGEVFATWVRSPTSTRFSRCGDAGCLDLSFCGLQSLPRALFSLLGVTHLHVAYNENLSCIAGIGRLPGLTLLDARQCALDEVPDEFGQLQLLVSVLLDGNTKISKLPDSLAKCPALEVLIVTDCTSLAALPDALGTSERPLAILCENIPRIIIPDTTLMAASELVATKCELSTDALIAIAALVQRNVTPKLSTLFLTDAQTDATQEVVDAFERAMRSNTSMINLQGVTSAYISEALERNSRAARALGINSSPVSL